MAEICCDVVGEDESASDTCSRTARRRRRRIELRRVRTGSGGIPSLTADHEREGSEINAKRRSLEADHRKCVDSGFTLESTKSKEKMEFQSHSLPSPPILSSVNSPLSATPPSDVRPKFGMTSVCGRRRDMEDSVASHPSFFRMPQRDKNTHQILHYFGVYDGHGCSHVARQCGEKLHEVMKEELGLDDEESGRGGDDWWKNAMERSFSRMDKEVIPSNGDGTGGTPASCRCGLKTPACDIVGSTAVVAVVTPDKIIVGNCGDSRAVLCRNGNAAPLSNDHKPDRPDEQNRIEAAGGRVIFRECARVLGVLATSRAIGDKYLKPYVICRPEVTITNRREGDECLILASDGLWDVVSNDTACAVARMCLGMDGGGTTAACVDASMLLTKLGLARGSADNISVLVVDVRKR